MSASLIPSTAPPRYNTPAIALHWVLAAGIVALFVLGLYMQGLAFSPWRLKLYNWHKWAGISVLVLSVLRLGWRLMHRPPALPDSIARAMPGWQTRAYHATHHLLYLLFFAVPLLGWAYSSAAGFPIVWLGLLPLPDLLPADQALAELVKPWHQWSAMALIGLSLLHIAAALKHHWVDRDGLLQRVLPAYRNPQPCISKQVIP